MILNQVFSVCVDCRSLVASLLVVIFRDKMDYATE